MMTSEKLASIIERAQNHDNDAFETLVDLYAARLYGFLYRMIGQRDEAEDLVQEVFIRVVRMIGQYREEGLFEAWLFRIAVNLARDHVRKQRRIPAITSFGAAGEEDGELSGAARVCDTSTARPEGALERAENIDRLEAALAKITPEEREVVMLRHYTSMSFAEIARVMGTPLGTALARAHRGLAKLRKWMEVLP